MRRTARRLLLGLAVVGAVYAGIAFMLPGDTVTTRYDSLADARTDKVIERGWLPDILPPSTHNIRTTNDLARNVSSGEFFFAPPHYPDLGSRLSADINAIRASLTQVQEMAQMRRKGFQVGAYVQGPATWVFFCKPETGYCEYTMWSSTPDG